MFRYKYLFFKYARSFWQLSDDFCCCYISGSIWIYPVFGDLTNFKSLNVLCTPEVQLECTDCDHLLLQFAALAVTADWLVMLLGLVGYCLILLLDVKKMESVC